MYPQVITPDTPCTLLGLYASRSDVYFWIGYTAYPPQEYVARQVETARQDGYGSAALKAAIQDILARGEGVKFYVLEQGFPYGEAKQKKMEAIAYYLDEGHPLCNGEVRKIERAQEREAHAEERAAEFARRAERRKQRTATQEQKRKDKELYGWPAAPEGCMNIYAEEEWTADAEPRVVRIGSTKNSAGTTNRTIGYTMLAHPFTPQAQRVRDQKARGVRRRLRLLEVHPRAGIKERKDAWAWHFGVGP